MTKKNTTKATSWNTNSKAEYIQQRRYANGWYGIKIGDLTIGLESRDDAREAITGLRYVHDIAADARKVRKVRKGYKASRVAGIDTRVDKDGWITFRADVFVMSFAETKDAKDFERALMAYTQKVVS